MTEETNAVIDPLALSREVNEPYRNVSLGPVNDHEIRMSVMTEQFRWHRHPDSDETFYGVDGELIIEFPDREVVVRPGQFVTVPAGTYRVVFTGLMNADKRPADVNQAATPSFEVR
jgi:mannose-6-phosphate isomerase-like protein (cupin superfamily)